MTDAYIFEVHPDSDVIQVNGKEAVRAKYAFDGLSLVFTTNNDPCHTLPTCGRHKEGGVLACVAIMRKDQFHQAAVPDDCFIEKSC